jgi:hypothetical protein
MTTRAQVLARRLALVFHTPRAHWTASQRDRLLAVLLARADRWRVFHTPHAGLPGYRTDRRST